MNNNVLKQQGRSMIEMLGVLAIIGVLSAGGIAGYSAAMENANINKFIEFMNYATAKAETLFGKFETNAQEYNFKQLCDLNVAKGTICNKTAADYGASYRKGYFGEKIRFRAIVNSASSHSAYKPVSIDGDNISVYQPYAFLTFDFFEAIPVSVCAKILSHQAWGQLGEFVGTEGLSPPLELPTSPAQATTVCENRVKSYSGGRFIGIDIFIKTSGIIIE